MGYVRVKGTLSNPKASPGSIQEVDFMVDTGAFFTTIGPDVARKLGIAETARTKATLADNREIEMSLSYAQIRIDDREAVLPIAIMETPEPLLGVTTLEGLGLKVDPSSGTVEKTRSFAIGMMACPGL